MDLQLMKLRKAAGFRNRDDFAELLGVNKYTYRSWESGTAMMSLEQACRVADVLGCTLEELVGRATPRIEPTIIDPMARELVDCYESLNPDGRTNLLGVARGLHALPEWRAGDGSRAVQAQGRESA